MLPILKLRNEVLPYAWGSKTALAERLGIANPSGAPQAELWMGAHPKAPSRALIDGAWVPLDRLIAERPREILGSAAGRFDARLPFLFKVLAAAKPLSIQAHPDRDRAQEGFQREERLGIPRAADARNYRDPHPKPECLLALEPFDGLCGFRDPGRIAELFTALAPVGLRPAIAALEGRPPEQGLAEMLRVLLTLAPEACRRVLAEARGRLERVEEDVARWIERLYSTFHEDRPPGRRPDIGILAPAWLNLFRLEPGEALFLRPGVLHAYLHGTAIEIMGNSDNVVRGGLTDKHIDVPELLRILAFAPGPVERVAPRPVSATETLYRVPVAEFTLAAIRLRRGVEHLSATARSVEILLCTEGSARLVSGNESGEIRRGESLLVPACAPAYRLVGEGVIYRASAGDGP